MKQAPGDATPIESQTHTLYLEERKLLIDAAREGSRTFDKAVLTFGAAAFGASVALLKDVVPRPSLQTLIWLEVAWVSFSFGVLVILLSFLFSQRACFFEIERAYDASTGRDSKRRNPWAALTNACNWMSVGLFFVGILLWVHFVVANLTILEATPMTDTVKKGYVPPAPPKQPPAPPAQQPVQQPPPKKGK